MQRTATMVAAAGLALACDLSWPVLAQTPVAPKGPLNTLNDIRDAIRGCWQWPPLSATRTGMELTVLLSFKRNGQIFGARITYQTHDVAPPERDLYYAALIQTLKLCSPLPVSPSLGEAIAGRLFTFRFVDHRQQRKASLNG